MKYVVMRVTRGTGYMEFPIIFPDALVHADVAQAVQVPLMRMFTDASHIGPVSAGELSSYGIRSSPVGESGTLKLKSRDEDSTLIAMADYGSCFANM